MMLLLTGMLLPLSTWGQTVTEQQRQTIRKLGELNGIALQCDYLAETQRMKKALIASLPKRRGLGQLFDDTTHESFLGFIQQGKPCPEEDMFLGRVDQAIKNLEQAFGSE